MIFELMLIAVIVLMWESSVDARSEKKRAKAEQERKLAYRNPYWPSVG